MTMLVICATYVDLGSLKVPNNGYKHTLQIALNAAQHPVVDSQSGAQTKFLAGNMSCGALLHFQA